MPSWWGRSVRLGVKFTSGWSPSESGAGFERLSLDEPESCVGRTGAKGSNPAKNGVGVGLGSASEWVVTAQSTVKPCSRRDLFSACTYQTVEAINVMVKMLNKVIKFRLIII